MKYALFMMLLIGLLVPMTIASSSIDFDLNTVLFDNQEVAITVDVLKSVHPIKTKFMITKEGAEGIRKRSYIGSKVDMFNYISAYPPSRFTVDTLFKYGIDLNAKYKIHSVNKLDVNGLKSHAIELVIYSDLGISPRCKDTNYIRYL